ncbi:aspartate/glutamate racemase family protein [Virgibacillus alimentarius]|uniref:Allantoin racemase n=1 Tax=Virgibacillus alimentarius TaxID=698769 RepID=A0ABS4SE42_9BACI|nr:aspartate/glutamate racemase family protein [Virgibacillus alimentarius]MBP2259144.1 allantoin racemase [Virgibacillus alimentarius]
MNKKIMLINPIHTSEYDKDFIYQLNKYKNNETKVKVVSFQDNVGPTHLEYNCYESVVIPKLLKTVKKAEEDGYDAAIIGCFYDPALRACREIVENMVITAPAESAMHIATTLGDNFSIIVGRRKWIPEMSDNVLKYGFDKKLASFKPLGLGVHDFQTNPEVTKQKIREAATEAIEKDLADSIILGCTVEFGFFADLQADLGIPVIDASLAPFKYAEFLIDLKNKLNWSHCKKIGYESPPIQEVSEFNLF